MEICTNCQNNHKIVDIFVFIPGVNDQGIHNTTIIGKLCEQCYEKYRAGDTTVTQSEPHAMTLQELIDIVKV